MQHLPMEGLTHGNRSPVTCELKCGSACAYPPSNPSTEPSFRDVVGLRLSRRTLLLGSGALAAGAVLPALVPTAGEASAAGRTRSGGLPFTAIEPVPAATDDLVVPEGYEWFPIIRWGDPLFHTSPPFDPAVPDAEAQEEQFGYNNDYLDILVTDRRGRHALLCCNHEFVNRAIMFPPRTGAAELELLRALMAAVGFSVVELERSGKGRRWRYIRGARLNRRITATTPFLLTGAAAGDPLLQTGADPTGTRVLGTFNNCSGGTTPWGTILSGEENFHNYFQSNFPAGTPPTTPLYVQRRRYGFNLTRASSTYLWERVDPRFNATSPAYVNEPNRFGYIVEIDPHDPSSTPRKHTALGRFKHEGANVRVDADGRVAAYMGDDERFEYLYKFVSSRRFRPGGSRSARANNLELLTDGDLYVARFSGEDRADNANVGVGTWIPLVKDGVSVVPEMSIADVLVFTRLAADAVQATRMDRPEDVQPHPRTGKVYVACTNNTQRGTAAGMPGADAANPRPDLDANGLPLPGGNKHGHVIEITEDDDRVDATTFSWNLLLVCGPPGEVGNYFAGYEGPVSPISCPDNLAFDSEGNLWISTDGMQGIAYCDALFKVPLAGEDRGRVQQFLATPINSETTGPVIHDRDGSVFVAVQHPGDGGSWAAQRSFFPDYLDKRTARPGDWLGPRPSVVQVIRQRPT